MRLRLLFFFVYATSPILLAHYIVHAAQKDQPSVEAACQSPGDPALRVSCAEYREAISIVKGAHGLREVFGIRPLTNFHLAPAHEGPLVHDSLRQPLCAKCLCHANEGSYYVLGFSSDNKMALMEKMTESEGVVCEKGTRFFIPIDWLRPGRHAATSRPTPLAKTNSAISN